MNQKPIPNTAISLLALIAGLEGVVAVFFLARESSEAENIFFLGLSAARLFLSIGALIFALFLILIAFALFYHHIFWAEKINRRPARIRIGLVSTFILTILLLYVLFLIPDYQIPALSGYLSRLKPVLIWLVLIFAQTFIVFAYYGYFSFESLKGWTGSRPLIVVIVFIGILCGVIASTKVGLLPDAFYWNMAGVPLLAWQVWVAIGVGFLSVVLYSRLGRKQEFKKASSVATFFLIWIIAAFIWIKTPLAPTFNAPGPYLPSKDFYPFVDAALFDLGAQTALYGKGFFFGTFFDRGLLTGFLAFLHLLFGQNYLVVVGAQAAVYAIFPALLYLLGKRLHSTFAGILIAALAIFKVSNAISGGKILSTSHPKVMLTDFPTGVVLVLFSLLLMLWLEKPDAKPHYPAGIGAIIGIGILLRTHVFFMVPVVIAFGFMVWKQRWQRALRDLVLVVAAFFITVSPWMWRNDRVAEEPLFFLRRFDSVIEERYQPQSGFDVNRLAARPSQRALKSRENVGRDEINNLFEEVQFVPNHFAHNLITSVLILPPSPALDDLRHTVNNYPYWTTNSNVWLSDISISMVLSLAINLVILSIGIGKAWKRTRWIALVPLTVFLFYNLANAFARTSGGRYIVPVDWVVYFYYAMGLAEIIRFLVVAMGFREHDLFKNVRVQAGEDENGMLNLHRAGLMVLPFFLMVAALPGLELASPGETQLESPSSLLQRLEQVSFFEETGLSRSDVQEFLDEPDAILLSGRGFYPRYYSFMQGEPILPGYNTPYTQKEYSRLVFTLLLSDIDQPVLLPMDEPQLRFPDAANLIVGGCRVNQVSQNTSLVSYLNYIDAAFIVILDEPTTIYKRTPAAPLVCPLREPVCDNNHQCD